MALPKEAENVQIRQDVRFDRTGTITPVKVISFTVGLHGPFTIGIPLSDYSVELAERMVTKEINDLRRLGVIA